MSSRPKPLEKIRWTRAEKVNAAVWATEWGVTIFCVASSFAGIVMTRNAPMYVFVPTALAATLLAAFSFTLRGKLRAIFRTQKRANNQGSGYYRIAMLYGNEGDTAYFPAAKPPALKNSAGERTQRFNPIEEYSHS